MKQQACKFLLENGTKCGSVFHTAMYHNPPKPVKRTVNWKPDKDGLHREITGIHIVETPLTYPAPKYKKKKSKIIRKRADSRSKLVKKLDSVFSQYIRQKYAIDGMTACVTCGTVKRWQEQQNGHYMSRGHLPTRWSEDNCAPQCYACNVLRKGHYVEYSLWMIDTYGVEKLEELKQRANSGEKIATVTIKEMIEKYTKLLTSIS